MSMNVRDVAVAHIWERSDKYSGNLCSRVEHDFPHFPLIPAPQSIEGGAAILGLGYVDCGPEADESPDRKDCLREDTNAQCGKPRANNGRVLWPWNKPVEGNNGPPLCNEIWP